MHRCKHNRTYTQVSGNVHIEGFAPQLAGRVEERHSAYLAMPELARDLDFQTD